MTAYSNRKRFEDTLQGRTEDRVPVFAGTGLWAAANFPEASFSRIASDPDWILKAQLWARDVTGLDGLYPNADPLFIAEAFGCKVRFPESGPIAEPLGLTLDTLEDVERLPLPNPRESERLPVVLEATRRLRESTLDEAVLIGAFEGAFTNTCRVFEAERILRMIHKRPRVLEVLLDRVNEVLIEFGRALVDSGVNALFIPEPTASCAMISPLAFSRYVLPRLRELTSRIDVPVILHICGHTAPILPAMGESGAEIISLDQCMDLSAARAALPGKILAGNVDPVTSLLLGNTEKVREDALGCLRKAGTSRFILMPGCAVPPNTPVGNLRAMVNAAAEYGLGS
jgi:uroporphyrinogen decarboxylase